MSSVIKVEYVTGHDGQQIDVSRLATDTDIMNPKLMAPTCAAVWEWYRTVGARLKTALITRDGIAVENIVDEIEAHAVEIEYLCKT